METNNRTAKTLKTVLLTAILLLYLVPFLLVLINSVKPTREFLENPLALPQMAERFAQCSHIWFHLCG